MTKGENYPDLEGPTKINHLQQLYIDNVLTYDVENFKCSG